ncbi:MAG: hypothetical protein JJU16_03395 [Alkalibacterium sp.]|nr:hypothetical protein [Alkalibacterium sp.]
MYSIKVIQFEVDISLVKLELSYILYGESSESRINMTEIGGYFQLDLLPNNPYHVKALKLNTARNALIYLVKAKKIKKLFLPYFLCNSVSDMLDRNGVKYEYYNIGKDFKPLFKKELEEGSYLYIVNYYGQISDNEIICMKNKYANIILDNTHAFYNKPVHDIDTLYSCRKFFGVPDGAYLYTSSSLEETLEVDKSFDRMSHILGRFEGRATDFYNEFKKNDEKFKTLELRQMSALTSNLLGAIDYDNVSSIRNENYEYLNTHLNEINPLKLIKPLVPFSYPLLVKDGLTIKKRLTEKNIFIPTLWPNVIDNVPERTIEYDYSANILPIPCDQRYTTIHMKTIIEALKELL